MISNKTDTDDNNKITKSKFDYYDNLLKNELIPFSELIKYQKYYYFEYCDTNKKKKNFFFKIILLMKKLIIII